MTAVSATRTPSIEPLVLVAAAVAVTTAEGDSLGLTATAEFDWSDF